MKNFKLSNTSVSISDKIELIKLILNNRASVENSSELVAAVMNSIFEEVKTK